MEEEKRYNEPKRIGDILKDMHMDTKGLEHQRSLKEHSKKFANDLSKIMEKYKQLIDLLDQTYTHKVTSFVKGMDNYYAQERASLFAYKKNIATGRITQEDIKNKLHLIEKNLDAFEREFYTITHILRITIEQFDTQDDRQTETKKANNFHKLFLAMYSDIDDLLMDYERLLRKLPRR